jgi:hypothetical protein
VQGLVTYYDATEDTGGLCVIPASHRAHDELCNRSASAKSLIDFVSVNAHDPILSGGGILVCAQAGGTGRCATHSPPTPLILCLLQIWCCGTVELCTATLQRCRKHISSHCLRKSSGSKLQRSRGISFGCAATYACYRALTQRRRSCKEKSSCFQTGAKCLSTSPLCLQTLPSLPLSSFPSSHRPAHSCSMLEANPSFDAAKLPLRQRQLIGCPKRAEPKRAESNCVLS